jgi:hypothetical protein
LLIQVESEFCARFGCCLARGAVFVSPLCEEYAEEDGVNKHKSSLRLGPLGSPVLRINAPIFEGALQPGAL